MDSFLLPLLWLIISFGWSIYAYRIWKTQFLIMPLPITIGMHSKWLSSMLVFLLVINCHWVQVSSLQFFFCFEKLCCFPQTFVGIWRLFQVRSEGLNVHPLLTITSWNSYNLLLSHSVFTQMVEVTNKYQNKFKCVQDH